MGTDPFFSDAQNRGVIVVPAEPYDEPTVTRPYVSVPAWLLAHPDLNDNALRVCGVLMMFANDDHYAWPSRARIGETCGKDARTVDRAIKALVAAGLVQKVDRRSPDGGNLANGYRLLFMDGNR